MRRTAVAIAGLATLALSEVSAGAEPVPDGATGVWSLGTECNAGTPVLMVNSRSALVIEDQAVAIARAEYVAGSLVLSFENGADELVLPPMDNLRECRVLPGMFPVMFAETIAVFRRFDEIHEACLGGDGMGPLCAAVGFELIDITSDGVLSRPEIARAIRATAFFVGYRLTVEEQETAFVPVDDLMLAWFAGSALGPTIAGNLVDSYDYDGDGLLSLAELMQDRTPEEGLEGALAAMAGEMAPEALSTVIRSATGVLDFLR